jgi:hypothetical protein
MMRYGLVTKQGITRLRYAREEARVGIKTVMDVPEVRATQAKALALLPR